MSERPKDDRALKAPPSDRPKQGDAQAEPQERVIRQREHIKALTGEDPLASRDD